MGQIANGGSTLILLVATCAMGYMIYKLLKERDTIREGYQAALAERDKQVDDIKTEYGASLQATVKEYVEELKLIREELAKARVINDQAKRVLERLEDKLSQQ